jgi:hypothetical protein
MCDPISLGVASLVATVAGTGMAAYGQMQAGKAAANQQEQSARMASLQASNAKVRAEQQREIVNSNIVTAKNAAADARARGEQAIEAQRIKQGQLAGRQRAVMAASGTELGFGSSLDVLGDTAMLGEYDAETLKSNSENEARRFGQQADILGKQASSLITDGDNAIEAGELSAASFQQAASNSYSAGATNAMSSLLQGAGSVADKWYKMGPTVRGGLSI